MVDNFFKIKMKCAVFTALVLMFMCVYTLSVKAVVQPDGTIPKKYETSADGTVVSVLYEVGDKYDGTRSSRYPMDFSKADAFQYVNFYLNVYCPSCHTFSQSDSNYHKLILDGEEFTFTGTGNTPRVSGEMDVSSKSLPGMTYLRMIVESNLLEPCPGCGNFYKVEHRMGDVKIIDYRGTASLLSHYDAKAGRSIAITPIATNGRVANYRWGISTTRNGEFPVLSDSTLTGGTLDGVVVSGSQTGTLTLSNLPDGAVNLYVKVYPYDKDFSLPANPSVSMANVITEIAVTGTRAEAAAEDNNNFGGGSGNGGNTGAGGDGNTGTGGGSGTGGASGGDSGNGGSGGSASNNGGTGGNGGNTGSGSNTGGGSGAGGSSGGNGSGGTNTGTGGNSGGGSTSGNGGGNGSGGGNNSGGGGNGNNGGNNSGGTPTGSSSNKLDDYKDTAQNEYVTGTTVRHPIGQETPNSTSSKGVSGSGESGSGSSSNRNVSGSSNRTASGGSNGSNGSGTSGGRTDNPTPISEDDRERLFDKIRHNSSEYVTNKETSNRNLKENASGNSGGEVKLESLNDDSDVETYKDEASENLADYSPAVKKRSRLFYVFLIILIILLMLILLFVLFFGVIIAAPKENELIRLNEDLEIKVPVALRLLTLKDGTWAINFGELLSKHEILYVYVGILFAYVYENEEIKIMTRFKGEEKKVIATEKIRRQFNVGSKRGMK